MYAKLTQVLVAKGKADDQQSWRVIQNEKLERLRDRLRRRKEHILQEKARIDKISHELKIKFKLLESSMSTLEKNRVEQIEKYYPNFIREQNSSYMLLTNERLHKQSIVIKQICKLFPQRRVIREGDGKDGYNRPYDTICGARLPRGLDPHSVHSDELAASLGYMVQLLNLVVHVVCGPALHNSGFAGSCSRIWQRNSYWDTRPSSRSEYPLFIPRQKVCSAGAETPWSERSSSNFGVASVESERKPRLDSSGSFSYSSASPHSIEIHKDLQKGISLLKKSVACITAYCYNSLSLELPQEASTFEAFARLLSTLSSSKELRAVLSSRTGSLRPSRTVQQLNKSVWDVESDTSSSTLTESTHGMPIMRNMFDNYLQSSVASYLDPNEFCDVAKHENLIEGWDLVEHPTYPPPPSQTEDVEHWTRAMIIDATKK